jgi:hypothetical protein
VLGEVGGAPVLQVEAAAAAMPTVVERGDPAEESFPAPAGGPGGRSSGQCTSSERARRSSERARGSSERVRGVGGGGGAGAGIWRGREGGSGER